MSMASAIRRSNRVADTADAADAAQQDKGKGNGDVRSSGSAGSREARPEPVDTTTTQQQKEEGRRRRGSWVPGGRAQRSAPTRTSGRRASVNFSTYSKEDDELLQNAVAGANGYTNSMVSPKLILRPQLYDYTPPSQESDRYRIPRWLAVLGVICLQAILCAAISLYLSEAVGWSPAQATLFALQTLTWRDASLPPGRVLSDSDTAAIMVFAVLSYAASIVVLMCLSHHAVRRLHQFHLEVYHTRLRRAFPGLPPSPTPSAPASSADRRAGVPPVSLALKAAVASPFTLPAAVAVLLLCIVFFALALSSLDASLTYPEALMWCISSATLLPTTAHPRDNHAKAVACVLLLVLVACSIVVLVLLLLGTVRRVIYKLGPPPAFKIVSRLHGRLDGGTLISRYEWYALVLDAANYMDSSTKTMLDTVFQECLARSQSASAAAVDAVPWSVIVDVCSTPQVAPSPERHTSTTSALSSGRVLQTPDDEEGCITTHL